MSLHHHHRCTTAMGDRLLFFCGVLFNREHGGHNKENNPYPKDGNNRYRGQRKSYHPCPLCKVHDHSWRECPEKNAPRNAAHKERIDAIFKNIANGTEALKNYQAQQ